MSNPNKILLNRLKLSINKTKNDLELVAKMLGIPEEDTEAKTCKSIIKYLKSIKKDNPYVQYLLKEIPSGKLQCATLVSALKDLIKPVRQLSNLPSTRISDELYEQLLKKYNNDTITLKEQNILDEALNIKYCYCAKNIYIRNIWNQTIMNNNNEVNPYAVCINSIYKNRDIPVPDNLVASCKSKYSKSY